MGDLTPLVSLGNGRPDPIGFWHPDDRLSFRFAVINLTDTDPPLLGRNADPAQANTDPSTYDVLGRRYQASVSLRL
jgi:outer membrane receptor protein involved in Fe transport